MKARKRQTWQADPREIKTDTVQFWTVNGTMATGQMSQDTARRLVMEGRAFVVSDQAVGQCEND